MTASLTVWLRDNAALLRTLDPADEDTGDLEPLREVVGDARVVALGESAHKVHQFYRCKDRIFRFLVRGLGFSAWVMESGFPEGLVTNAWVTGAPGAVSDISRSGVTYFMGACREFEAQLSWLRQLNRERDRPVRFWGADLPAHSAAHRPALDFVLDFLDDADPAQAAWVREQVYPLLAGVPHPVSPFSQSAAIEAYAALSQPQRNQLSGHLCDLGARLQALRHVYAGRTTPEQADRALRCAVVAQQLDASLRQAVAGAADGPDGGREQPNIRDAALADNVLWILEREERVVLSGHNAHIMRAPLGVPSATTLGEHLHDALGEQYRVVATTYGSGSIFQHGVAGGRLTTRVGALPRLPETSLDRALAEVGHPHFLVDLRRLPTTGPVAAEFGAIEGLLVNDQPMAVDIRTAFDAIVHIDAVSCYDATTPEFAELLAPGGSDSRQE